MKYIYLAIGIPLLLIGFVLVADQRTSPNDILGELLKFGSLISGGILLNRAMSNKPLFPGGHNGDQMILNARKRWTLGATAIALLALSVAFLTLGTDRYFAYANTFPWLTMTGVLMLGGSGAYFLWRYLRFVIYGEQL